MQPNSDGLDPNIHELIAIMQEMEAKCYAEDAKPRLIAYLAKIKLQALLWKLDAEGERRAE